MATDRESLLRSRCTAEDWGAWQLRSRADAPWSRTRAHSDRVVAAIRSIETFACGDRGYIGVSWGKDSCALLLLALSVGLDWPVVHVDLSPVRNPDCAFVRDAWLAAWPGLAARYHEVTVACRPKASTGRFDTNAAYAEGFAIAEARFGRRRLSGVRGEESGARDMAMRVRGRGGRDDVTGRPIGWWRSEDVFAYLRESPLHPAYPCTMDGAIDRHRVRVNNLWGLYGEGHGRAEWEQRYYGDALRLARQEYAHCRGIQKSTGG